MCNTTFKVNHESTPPLHRVIRKSQKNGSICGFRTRNASCPTLDCSLQPLKDIPLQREQFLQHNTRNWSWNRMVCVGTGNAAIPLEYEGLGISGI